LVAPDALRELFLDWLRAPGRPSCAHGPVTPADSVPGSCHLEFRHSPIDLQELNNHPVPATQPTPNVSSVRAPSNLKPGFAANLDDVQTRTVEAW